MAIDVAYMRARWPGSFGNTTVVSDFSLGEAITAASLQINPSEFGTTLSEATALLAAHFAELGKLSRAGGRVEGSAGQVSGKFATDADGNQVTAFYQLYCALKRKRVLSIGLAGGGGGSVAGSF